MAVAASLRLALPLHAFLNESCYSGCPRPELSVLFLSFLVPGSYLALSLLELDSLFPSGHITFRNHSHVDTNRNDSRA